MLKDFVKLQPDEALGIFRVLNINLVDKEKKEVILWGCNLIYKKLAL